TSEGIVPGLLHDHCSAVHQVAAASPFLRSLGDAGPTWLSAEVDCVHPLDGGGAGVLHRSIDRTAAGLGTDGDRWRRLFGLLTSDFDGLFADATQPIIRVPRHPILLGRFGAASVLPATALAKAWREPETKALFAGVAAHAYHPLNRPMTSAIGLMLIAAGHVNGWVVAKGGSRAITDALAADLERHGGKIVTGTVVRSAAELDAHDILLLDVSPSAAADILGDRLPGRIAKAYRRFRHGPGAFKVDFAVEGGVPWTARAARAAGTVHLGGDLAEVVAGERAVHRGRLPERPFVLVSQQYLADPGRSVGSIHPVWTYAHVPHGYSGDATDRIVDQIERFAPGFRERIVGQAVRSTTELSVYNANYVGGDIIGGASTPTQVLFRPRPAVDPYFTGVPGAYLCSASTPPGAGAHGLCGVQAANRALASV
ncbi:MAG: NAD(P)/FAD-dependent oxidoreductase, partial [Actinomycetota bacterium]